MTTLLLIDDDLDLLEILDFALKRAGFHVVLASDQPTAASLIEDARPALVVLEPNLGTSDGFELLRILRRRSNVPVILLSNLSGEQDKIRGLDLGADDYVTKPFSHGELMARIRAHLRRVDEGWTVRSTNGVLQSGPLTINTAEHVAFKNGDRLPLTVTEYRLLHYLMVNSGHVVTSRAIAKHVWGYDDANTNEIVRVTVYRLRKKLEDDPVNPDLVKTVAGVGILLRSGPVTAA